MRYVSVFSGVEAASCAWDGMGWEPAVTIMYRIDDLYCEMQNTISRLFDIDEAEDARAADGAEAERKDTA